METLKNFVTNNKWAQFLLVLVAGIAIGALFYPTKHIEETITQKYESEMKTLKEQHAKEEQQSKEALDKQVQEFKSYKSETEIKISKLVVENKDLKSKQKTAYYKIVRPDGTIEIKRFTESEVNESTKVITQIQTEFTQKVEAIEAKWEKIHKERVTSLKKEFDSKEEAYKKEIAEYQSKKVVDINPKKYGIAAGMLLDKSYLVQGEADVFGPVYVGVQGVTGKTNTIGGLLGLRF